MKLNAIIHKEGEMPFVRATLERAAKNTDTPILSDKEPRGGREAVFGDTEREISRKAKALLEAKRDASLSGYLIYSDGMDIAVVWSDFQLCEAAVDKFLKAPEVNEKGEVYSSFFPLLSYLKEREERLIEKKWSSLSAAIPEEYREGVVDALRRLRSLCDFEAAARWFASLYDPQTGGFYITASAKNSEGFCPDIESTLYGLNVMSFMGMAEMFEGDWAKAMPKDLLDKTVGWIYSLQEEDGYFYVPRWPKSFIEKKGCQIRITRDGGSARTILRKAGIEPKYAPFSLCKEKKGGAEKKSKLLSQYETVENFKEYLDGWERELEGLDDGQRANKFYVWGSYFQSTIGLMNEEMRRMAVEFFDRHQNEKNGMWSEGLHYASTNAIHKMCSCYNYFGAEMKHAEKIVESTLEILKWDVKTKPVPTGVDIYNVWSVFPYIYDNIRKCSKGTPEEREARCDRIKGLIFKGVADAINTTYEQLKDFKTDDGSFSCFRDHSVSSAHGCVCSVPGTKEGDAGGYLIIAYDMPHYILAALELLEHEIPYFTEYGRQIYIEGLRNSVPKEKGHLNVIIRNEKEESDVLRAIIDAEKYMKDRLTTPVARFRDCDQLFPHETVFGDTSREISKKAMVLLSELTEDKSHSGFLIYSDGGSVAVVWTEAALSRSAIKYYLENYLGKRLGEGVIYSEICPTPSAP